MKDEVQRQRLVSYSRASRVAQFAWAARHLIARTAAFPALGMRIIPTFANGVIDYLAALAFFVTPEIFGFADGPSAAVLVPRVLGVLSLLYSAGTAYELGIVKAISMRTHLAIDYAVALTFLGSPFVFGFIDGPARQWLPHIGTAVFVIIVTTLSQTEPARRPR